MRYVITGAGQIGTQLAKVLVSAGHSVTVVRRGTGAVDGADLLRGDAGDRDLMRRAVEGDGGAGRQAGPATAVFHCIHTSYDSRAWREHLPSREQVVMDVAADAGVPVVFPESVYAFGAAAQELQEPLNQGLLSPASPLGEVRAELLTARRAHRARTLSVVAADLVGPTAEPKSSVFHLLVLGPAMSARTAWVLGDSDARRSATTIRDLTTAMVVAAEHASALAPDGDVVLTAPSTEPLSQREMVGSAAVASGVSPRPVRKIPWWVIRLAGFASPTMRELRANRYLWDMQAIMYPGALESRFNVQASRWDDVLQELVTARANAA